MEEWHDRWSQMWKDLTEVVDEFSRDITELTQEITTEAQDILYFQWDELKQVLTELWQELELEFEQIEQVNWDAPVSDRAIPNPLTHATCIGCINYNGTSFGGNLLVCGMHPYGCDSDSCLDWEGENDLN
jgi:hypothetical protein